MKCPSCVPRLYYGVLKGEQVPTDLVKYSKSDICPNCKTPLVPSHPPPGDSASA